MIDLAQYLLFIDEGSLNQLALGQRYEDGSGTISLTPQQQADRQSTIEKAETAAQAIIKQRYGSLPADSGFLETATVLGVIYVLSRKPNNKLSGDEVDTRRQAFFDMLPADPGRVSHAESQKTEGIPNWI